MGFGLKALLSHVGKSLPVALLFLAQFGSAQQFRDPLDKPNIVMLFVDDLGYGDLGFTGHPSTETPHIDRLAKGGKVLTSWYSGCPVCSGSRAALMTGRQYQRIGVPGVFGNSVNVGLPLNETTVANQAKKKGYVTAAMGKWHLGQREMFLPAQRGFDYYLGIPFSDDMGQARATPCNSTNGLLDFEDNSELYKQHGFLNPEHSSGGNDDPGSKYLPLVAQIMNKTEIVQQPLDFSELADRYNDYVTSFVKNHHNDPFFLYMAFSHVHTTASNQPEKQYAGCPFQNTTRRGKFGDALKEVDWLVGNVMSEIEKYGIEKNTLVLFSSDNGPWLIQGKSGGSPGIFYGRSAGYWNVGKGSTWEGGIREPAFAYWPGIIAPNTRSAEVVSSLDLLPTVSKLLGVPLPGDRVIDGRDMSGILLDKSKSEHEFLFFYGAGKCSGHKQGEKGPTAVRYGKYKAHFCTGPGIGGKSEPVVYYDPPLVFDIEQDPSEAYPLTENGQEPTDSSIALVVKDVRHALQKELETFTYGKLVPPPPQPSEMYEGKAYYAICCDREKGCECDGPPTFYY